MKQFDEELADFIISPGKRQHGRQNNESGQTVRPRLSIFIKNKDLSIEDNAAICLQAAVRGHLQRRKYRNVLAQKLMADMDEQNRMEAMRLEHWDLEQENARLERQIEERNAQFRIRIQRKVDAAIKIQRAYKRYRRFKLIGVGTAELDKIHDLEGEQRGELLQESQPLSSRLNQSTLPENFAGSLHLNLSDS